MRQALEDAVAKATLVAWDGCHKIYVALDEAEASYFRGNYDFWLQGSPLAMLNAVEGWWENSCSLRFITATHSNAEWVSIISQFSTTTVS
jgi:hypothetical protein